jgi:hypothetical protein
MMVYVCSPFRGEPPYTVVKRGKNLRKAAQYSKQVVMAGHTPITPHLYFVTFLNDGDPQERERGMTMGKELLSLCSELWVFGETISEGMKAEITLAEEIGIPVNYK